MPIDEASWYDPTPDTDSLYQGDVLEGVPVVSVPPPNLGPWILLRPPDKSPLTVEQLLAGNLPRHLRLLDEGTSQVSVNDAWQQGSELVLSRATKTKVMIMSQTCDLDNRTWIQVAPVHSAAQFTDKKMNSLETGEINFMFFLPPKPPAFLQKSFADLSLITTLHKSYLRSGNRILHLTAGARLRLQTHIARFYGRPFGFNTRDTVPQGASYLCANCVFTSGTIQSSDFVKDSPFNDCPKCGLDVLWVKYR
jgi:hypothetical protein